MPRTDRASRLIDAPIGVVFDALVDRDALEAWLPPGDMTGRFERFDPSPGGSYRLVLTYADPSESPGKSSSDSDVIEARFLDVVADERVVQAVDFESEAPEFAGTMTMTWSVREESGGTRVEFVADDVPDGISAEDHAAGLSSSLENLADFVES
ncbi:MAG: SRPBCC family protein [Ilumatobacter sp.]|uniref:SRPBCC family protein n=1 Tax=Ilumatobacter sp. TaxID=1967498 RepID=UPI0032999F67